MFIQLKVQEENEEKQDKMPNQQSSGSNQPLNPNREPGGGAKGMGESKTFYNTGYDDGENPNAHLQGIHKEK